MNTDQNEKELVIDVLAGVTIGSLRHSIENRRSEEIHLFFMEYLFPQKEEPNGGKSMDERAIVFVINGFVIHLLKSYDKNSVEQISIGSYTDSLKNHKEERTDVQKELHHRVSNNFQSVLGLLNIQNFSIEDEQIKAAFNIVIGKIKELISLHAELYNG